MKPQLSCLEELLANKDIRGCVPKITQIVDDVRHKLEDLKWEPVPVKLEKSETAAIVAYTHDLTQDVQSGNLYFELNQMLRQRGVAQRSALKQTWGGFMFYMMVGLNKLPDFKGVCWRGYNHETRAKIIQTYQVGRPIMWGAFTSVTTNIDAAKGFAQNTRVVFKIVVTAGRDINAYSFFPQEDEILLSPSARFTVSSEPRDEDGFTIIDLVQTVGNTFVS